MIKKTSPDEIVNYLSDAANVQGSCEAVYFPESEDDIIQVLNYANVNNIPVTVSGNGTGLTGGRVPGGGIVISTEKLNKILEINKTDKFARLQPGVILKDFQTEAESLGLFYPPDPTETNCFVGATAATNASGAKTFKYGPTRDYILGLEIILPDGEFLSLERGAIFARNYNLQLTTKSGKTLSLTLPDYEMPKTKHAAGYFCHPDMDAIDLFIGSEGTLGIITELKVKLLSLPVNILSAVVFFNDETDALSFISEARRLSFEARLNSLTGVIDARGLEYFDARSLKFLSDDYPLIPQSAEAAVWFEQEISDETEEAVLDDWMQLMEKFRADTENAWIASDKGDREKFKDFRHAISWKVSEYIVQHNLTKVGTDIAVPDEVFIPFYREIKTEAENSGLDFIIYGHFGNSHAHLNMLPKDPQEFKLAKDIYMGICLKAISLRGTVSAEHGIGKLKREYLLKMYGENNIRKMAALKVSLDPNKILNIGNIFSAEYLEKTEKG